MEDHRIPIDDGIWGILFDSWQHYQYLLASCRRSDEGQFPITVTYQLAKMGRRPQKEFEPRKTPKDTKKLPRTAHFLRLANACRWEKKSVCFVVKNKNARPEAGTRVMF